MKRIGIIAGEGEYYGTGHVQRMRVAANLLRQKGYWVNFRTVQTPSDVEKVFNGVESYSDYWIVDARDLDPTLMNGSLVLFLDNRNESRNAAAQKANFSFYDTLPHPELPLEVALENALIPDDLTNLADIKERFDGFAYVGRYSPEKFDAVLSYLLDHKFIREAFRIGEGIAEDKRIKVLKYLDRKDYVNILSMSKITVTYFGMTMLESWFAGVTPILVSTDPLHDHLAKDLSDKTRILYLDDTTRIAEDHSRLMQPVKSAPRQGGYDRLIETIESIF